MALNQWYLSCIEENMGYLKSIIWFTKTTLTFFMKNFDTKIAIYNYVCHVNKSDCQLKIYM